MSYSSVLSETLLRCQEFPSGLTSCTHIWITAFGFLWPELLVLALICEAASSDLCVSLHISLGLTSPGLQQAAKSLHGPDVFQCVCGEEQVAAGAQADVQKQRRSLGVGHLLL